MRVFLAISSIRLLPLLEVLMLSPINMLMPMAVPILPLAKYLWTRQPMQMQGWVETNADLVLRSMQCQVLAMVLGPPVDQARFRTLQMLRIRLLLPLFLPTGLIRSLGPRSMVNAAHQTGFQFFSLNHLRPHFRTVHRSARATRWRSFPR